MIVKAIQLENREMDCNSYYQKLALPLFEGIK
jgi:hypothetical protein